MSSLPSSPCSATIKNRQSADWSPFYEPDKTCIELNLHTLIAAVARLYATDPNYARLAAAIAGQENVSQAIAEARPEVAA